ncbi:MAG: tRNA epoxyqueuosine(34) reductase QueG [Phycisphaerales bacterium]|nr:MAG: tRNA epoxyqueuosine(34) reductase QueG [Phycisphaerales bacterium]
MRTPAMDRAREVIALARERGFARAGVCGVERSAHEAEFKAWLASGKQGSMAYLAEHADVRTDPAKLLDGARSALMVADLYGTRNGWDEEDPQAGVGRIARYARGRDYHSVIKKRLHDLADELRDRYPGEAFRSFVDSAPVFERELAARCGLGWRGKHTLVIHPRLGSWMVLGGFVTTMELEPPTEQKPVRDFCGSCTRCIEACPTDAITPYSVDASRCISYLTIERREAIPPVFHRAIGDWLVGCDICQEVCPHNSKRPSGRWSSGAGRVREEYEARRTGFDLLEVLGWDESARREAFTTSAMKRVTLAMMQRNAVIVAGNQIAAGVVTGERGAALRARLREIAAGEREDAMVRETARVVLAWVGDEEEG